MPIFLSVDEIEAQHKSLDIKIRQGLVVDAIDFARLFDAHTLILQKYRHLERAFLNFHGFSHQHYLVDPGVLRTEIRARPTGSGPLKQE